jgi:hypothetical protein
MAVNAYRSALPKLPEIGNAAPRREIVQSAYHAILGSTTWRISTFGLIAAAIEFQVKLVDLQPNPSWPKCPPLTDPCRERRDSLSDRTLHVRNADLALSDVTIPQTIVQCFDSPENERARVRGLQNVPNTAEDIRDAVVEMLDRLDGKAVCTEDDVRRQEEFRSLFS